MRAAEPGPYDDAGWRWMSTGRDPVPSAPAARPVGRAERRPVRSPTARPVLPSDDSPPDLAPTDAALVARVARGDQQAFGLLYDRFGALAYGLARAMVREAADADDVVAEAFAQLWRTADRYDAARGSVAAWVTTVTRTRALDHLRAARRRLQAAERAAGDDAEGIALPVAAAPPADEGLERRERAEAVQRQLAALPPAQREAVQLAFFGGLSHGEIAERLALPLGTVKSRVRLALQRLRDALHPLADAPSDGRTTARAPGASAAPPPAPPPSPPTREVTP